MFDVKAGFTDDQSAAALGQLNMDPCFEYSGPMRLDHLLLTGEQIESRVGIMCALRQNSPFFQIYFHMMTFLHIRFDPAAETSRQTACVCTC